MQPESTPPSVAGEGGAGGHAGPGKRLRIAIIGSGIGGLSATWLASREHECHLFEIKDKIGMDSNAVVLNGCRIDAPPRAFTPAYYPTLIRLYEEAGVEAAPFSWAFTYFEVGRTFPYFSVLAHSTTSHTIGGFRIPRVSHILGLLALLSPSNLRSMFHCVLFFRQMNRDWDNGNGRAQFSSVTLQQYLERGGYCDGCANRFLLPMVSMICSCSYDDCLQYPVALLMEYLCASNTQQMRTKYGTDDAAKRLAQGAKQIHLGTRIARVVPAGHDNNTSALVELFENGSEEKRVLEFDHVIFATEAMSAANLLPPTSPLVPVLNSFEYRASSVIVHTNPAVMPPRKSDWAAAALALDPNHSKVMFTLCMTHPDNVAAISHTAPPAPDGPPIFMTWNPFEDVLDSGKDEEIYRYDFQRSIVTPATESAVARLWELQGVGNVWVSGAFTLFRVPLQESAVRASARVCSRIGIDVPVPVLWDANDEAAIARGNDVAAPKRAGGWGVAAVGAGLVVAAAVAGFVWSDRRGLPSF